MADMGQYRSVRVKDDPCAICNDFEDRINEHGGCRFIMSPDLCKGALESEEPQLNVKETDDVRVPTTNDRRSGNRFTD